MRIWIVSAILLLVVLVTGCGGSNGTQSTTANSMVPEQFMTDLRNAIESSAASHDLSPIQNVISPSYLQNCETNADLLQAFQDTLGSGGTVTFTADPITNKSVNELKGRGQFDGGFDLQVDQMVGGVNQHRDLARHGTFYIRADNFQWKFYGNQECVH